MRDYFPVYKDVSCVLARLPPSSSIMPVARDGPCASSLRMLTRPGDNPHDSHPLQTLLNSSDVENFP